MAGIAGMAGSAPEETPRLLATMASALSHSNCATPECWHGATAGLCRVRVGRDNPAPQPLFSQDGATCITLFGECFDYEADRRELIRRGHVFGHPENDAEFVLELWREYGEAAFPKLSGSFAVALYDEREQELILVSDRLGTRPLFYARTEDGCLLFATQVSAILDTGKVSRDLDPAAIVEFCNLQRVLGTKTYNRAVAMLPAASILRYRSGRLTVSSYWSPQYRAQPGTANEYAEELASVMRRSAKAVARGGGKTAVLLSGGLDARMVVAAADSDLECYTFGDYLNPEARAARAIAAARGFPFHFVERPVAHYANLLDTAVRIGSGMYAFNHAHGVGFMEDLAGQCDVVTHGFAPELLFRGTNLPKVPKRLFGIEAGDRLDPSLRVENLTKRVLQRGYSQISKGVGELFAPGFRNWAADRLVEAAEELVSEAARHSSSIWDQFLWVDLSQHARYPSMLFELSLRPYLTERSLVFRNEVIDLHLKMPVEVRAGDDVWLRALRRLDRRVASVVNSNTGYSPSVPTVVQATMEIAKGWGRKLPGGWRIFQGDEGGGARAGASPISWPRFDWIVRHEPALRESIESTLSDPSALPPDIFDLSRVGQLFSEHIEGRGQHRTVLFALTTFGRWHKLFG